MISERGRKMLIKDYVNICTKFARDTYTWGSLDTYKFYTTKGNDDWKETCDNNCGGLDVSWAYNMTTAEIEKAAPQKFVDLIHAEITTAIDNDLTNDEIGDLVDELLKA